MRVPWSNMSGQCCEGDSSSMRPWWTCTHPHKPQGPKPRLMGVLAECFVDSSWGVGHLIKNCYVVIFHLLVYVPWGVIKRVSYHLPGSNEFWGFLALKLQNIKPLSWSLEFAPQQWSPSKLTVVIWTLLFQIPFAVWRLEGAGTFGESSFHYVNNKLSLKVSCHIFTSQIS